MQHHRSAGTGVILIALAFGLVPRGPVYAAETKDQIPPTKAVTAQHSLPPETLGDILMARGEFEAAINAYRQAPQTSAVVWNKMGMAWQHLYAVDEAKRDYERALRVRPKYPEALNNLGTIYYAKKNYKKAIKLYRRALKLMPRSATTYNNLGAAYFALGKYKQGESEYRAAFEIDPSVFSQASFQGVTGTPSTDQLAQLNYCLAELFAQAGKYDRAIEYLRTALNEGFRDHRKLKSDHAFAELRRTAAFGLLMKEEKIR
jgi:tetratricopeptide (TPR) repeat protein